jgi:Putative Actinobacterial Holin-X, holin superfamily III
MEERVTYDKNRGSRVGKQNAREQQSAIGLLRRLLNEFSILFRKEIALAKAEASEAFAQAKTGAISMASGGAVLFGGFLVLLAAAVLGLAHVVSDWLAALIVGAIVTVVGYVMVQTGKNKLDPEALKPDRTQRALRQDKEMVERRMT